MKRAAQEESSTFSQKKAKPSFDTKSEQGGVKLPLRPGTARESPMAKAQKTFNFTKKLDNCDRVSLYSSSTKKEQSGTLSQTATPKVSGAYKNSERIMFEKLQRDFRAALAEQGLQLDVNTLTFD